MNNNLPSSVTCSSSLLAYYLFNLSNQPSDTYGLIFGSHATRLKRDIEDGREFSHTEETTVVVKEFVFLDVSDENQRLFDFDNEVNHDLIAEQCSLKNKVGVKMDGDTSSNRQLIGWFVFNRSWHERFLYLYEQISEKMIEREKFKRPLLFVQAYDRIMGIDSKIVGVNETNIRAFVCDNFDENFKTLNPVDFKFTNVGDTSHKEYTEVLDRRLSSSDNADFLNSYFESCLADTLPNMIALQNNGLLTSAKSSLDNLINSISMDPLLRPLIPSTSIESVHPPVTNSCAINGSQPNAASFLKTPNLDSSPSEHSKFLITPAMAPHPHQPLAPVSLTNGGHKRESKLTDGIHSGPPSLDEVCDSMSISKIQEQLITIRSATNKRPKNEDPSVGGTTGKGRGQKK